MKRQRHKKTLKYSNAIIFPLCINEIEINDCVLFGWLLNLAENQAAGAQATALCQPTTVVRPATHGGRFAH